MVEVSTAGSEVRRLVEAAELVLLAGEECMEIGLEAANPLEEDFRRGKVLFILMSSVGVSGML